MKCDIELGSYTICQTSLKWWWHIHPAKDGCSINGDDEYATRSSALRAGRRWAKRLGLTVDVVYKYGDPEHGD